MAETPLESGGRLESQGWTDLQSQCDGALRQRLHLRGGLGRLDSPMLDVGCEGGRFVVMSHVFLGKELLTSEIP